MSADAFAPRARWVIETLLRTSDSPGATVDYPSQALPGSEAAWAYFAAGERSTPALGEDGVLDFGDGVPDLIASAFWHLSRWEERPGAPEDDHGRFPARAALADPGVPVVDALAARFRGALGLGEHTGQFTVALTHDVDSPWRWYGRRAVLGAASRAKRAAQERRGGDLGRELAGLLEAPVHAARRTDPNWSFDRIAEIERAHGGHSTYFVMTGHTRPADGPAPGAYTRRRAAIVTQVSAQGDEVGLHPSYATSDDLGLLTEEKARLESLTGTPTEGVRFHYLRHRAHRSLAQLDHLGFRYDSSQGFAETPGLRAGFSFPYQPYDLDRDRPLQLTELPLAVMDATLAERRYLDLDADAGLQRSVDVLERVAEVRGTVAILWHVDRYDRVYGNGWDRAYDRLLEWVVDRGGRLVTGAEAGATPLR
jgi:hypothetical protein